MKPFVYRSFRFLAVGIFLLLLFAAPGWAQDEVTVENIQFRGLQVWSPDNVTGVLEAHDLEEGQTYSSTELQRKVNQIIGELQDQGLFSDIKVTREDGTLIFTVEEFNRITSLKFEGNEIYDAEKLNDVLLLQSGDPVNPYRIEQARQDLVDFYRTEGYSDIDVSSSRTVTSEGTVELTFSIDEGRQRTINEVYFHYSPDPTTFDEAYRNLNLRLVLPAKPGQPYSNQVKERSVQVIKQWYSTLGYLDASVDVELWRNLSEDGIDMEFYIEEGPKYNLGDVQISGNELFSDTEIISDLPLQSGDVFNTRQFTRGIRQIEQKYRDRGYAEVSVDYRTAQKTDQDPPTVDVDVDVTENEPIYVERIEIHGNFRTYDRVIRREIRLEPGGLLDGEKKRNSLRRLRNLGYFSKVKMNVDPGSKSNWKVVRVRVKEGRTGQFQFGGGFSSSTGFTGNLSIRKDNFSLWDYSNAFTGRGQSIQASAQIGSRRSNFNISWDDPWFNDDLDDTTGVKPEVPIGVGFSAFNTTYFRDEGFDESRQGGAVRLSREFGPARSNQVDAEYSINTTSIKNLDEADRQTAIEFLNAADSGADKFEQSIGSLRLGIQRDRRDNRLYPSKGYFLRAQNRVAQEALASDVNFYNPEFDARNYIPFIGPTFWAVRFNYKTIEGFGGGEASEVPSFEKFFLGGNRTVRGYDYRDLAVYKKDCGPGDPDPTTYTRCSGGKSAFYSSLEYRYKVLERTMQLFAFTDIGNVYENSWEIGSDFKQSAGIGFRVRSPMGPINISWSQRMEPTTPDSNDSGQTQIDFNIGTGF
jgi:outer membrane protein insertion porin family